MQAAVDRIRKQSAAKEGNKMRKGKGEPRLQARRMMRGASRAMGKSRKQGSGHEVLKEEEADCPLFRRCK